MPHASHVYSAYSSTMHGMLTQVHYSSAPSLLVAIGALHDGSTSDSSKRTAHRHLRFGSLRVCMGCSPDLKMEHTLSQKLDQKEPKI